MPSLITNLVTLLALTVPLAASASDSASTTTVSLFNPGTTSTLPLTSLQASVIAANPTATTLAITCATSCILPSPFTVTEGPSTFTMSAVYSITTEGVQEKITIIEDCVITGSTQGASCSVSFGMEATYLGESTSTSYATVTQVPASEIFYEAVEVTGGVDKLDATASASATGTGAVEKGAAGRGLVVGGNEVWGMVVGVVGAVGMGMVLL